MDEIQQASNQTPTTLVPPAITSSTSQSVPKRTTPRILIILIIILTGVIGYFGFHYYQLSQELAKAQPTPSDTVTPLLGHYQNDKFGFEINYPQEWSLTAKEYDIQTDYRKYLRKCESGEIDGCGGSRWPDYQLEFYNNDKHYFNVNIHVIPLAQYLGGKENSGFTYSVQKINYNTNIAQTPTYYITDSMVELLQESLSFINPARPLGCLWIPDFVGIDISRPGINKSIYSTAKAYYYDNKKNSCQSEDIYYGDGPNIPFSSIDECQKSCVGR